MPVRTPISTRNSLLWAVQIVKSGAGFGIHSERDQQLSDGGGQKLIAGMSQGGLLSPSLLSKTDQPSLFCGHCLCVLSYTGSVTPIHLVHGLTQPLSMCMYVHEEWHGSTCVLVGHLYTLGAYVFFVPDSLPLARRTV